LREYGAAAKRGGNHRDDEKLSHEDAPRLVHSAIKAADWLAEVTAFLFMAGSPSR
jgi:hypothetical protein